MCKIKTVQVALYDIVSAVCTVLFYLETPGKLW